MLTEDAVKDLTAVLHSISQHEEISHVGDFRTTRLNLWGAKSYSTPIVQ